MFEWAWPGFALLLPLPWLLRWLLPPVKSQQPALRVSFLAELQHVSAEAAEPRLQRWKRQWPFLLIWLLLITALMRPQWQGDPLPLPQSGRDLMIAVDVSGSMDTPDMQSGDQQITRLEQVKQHFGPFIEQRAGDRVGLILFGSQAYLQSPLSMDRHTVRQWLDEAEVGIAGSSTAIGDAIGMAIKQLRQHPADSRSLILITDGRHNAGALSPMLAAQLAAAEHIRIYPIGIGSRDLGDIGQVADFDEELLQDIAELTGGKYFYAQDSEDLIKVGVALDALSPALQLQTQARWVTSLHIWPLSAAAILAWLMFAYRLQRQRRRT